MKNIIDYGELMGEKIGKIFGDEMSYNDLKSYAHFETKTWNVKVEQIENKEKETQLIAVYFNDNKVFEKTYSMHYSCDMFYHLSQLEIDSDESGVNMEKAN
jgi:hypothetical protein